MKKSYVNILMVILFSTTLVSFSYAGSSCCPGAGCCDTTNISVSQQQLRAPLTGYCSDQAWNSGKACAANKPYDLVDHGESNRKSTGYDPSGQGAAPEQTPQTDVVEANLKTTLHPRPPGASMQ